MERIRRCSISSKFGYESADPASLAAIVEMDADWGAAAFAELRSTGFIKTDWARFKWYQPSGKELDDKIAELAAIEAAAIIRLSSMDCAPALAAIRTLAENFLEEADGLRSSKATCSPLLRAWRMLRAMLRSGKSRAGQRLEMSASR